VVKTLLFILSTAESSRIRENSIKGLLVEIQCEKDFTERNILVSRPIATDSKYDFIIDVNHKLLRVQCKSSSLSDDGNYINLRTKTTNIRAMKDSYYSKDDIDYFYTCFNNVSYLVPIEDTKHGDCILRFKSKQPNNPNIRWAYNYELDKVLQNLTKEEVGC
jgi:hypothetical protein